MTELPPYLALLSYNSYGKTSERDLAIAEKLGASEMLFWEADYIDTRPKTQRDAIMKSMRAASSDAAPDRSK